MGTKGAEQPVDLGLATMVQILEELKRRSPEVLVAFYLKKEIDGQRAIAVGGAFGPTMATIVGEHLAAFLEKALAEGWVPPDFDKGPDINLD